MKAIDDGGDHVSENVPAPDDVRVNAREIENAHGDGGDDHANGFVNGYENDYNFVLVGVSKDYERIMKKVSSNFAFYMSFQNVKF